MTLSPTIPARSAHRWREFAHRLLLAAMLLGPAVAQGPAEDAAVRVLATEAEKLITSEDPVVRGEAALVLAATRNQGHHEAVLAVAKDKQQEASLRGLLALGLLATPGSEHVLETTLAESATRVRPEGVVAAYALGCLPPDAAPATVGRYLARVLQSNYRRQHDALLALLVALQQDSHPTLLPALAMLLDDAANRDLVLRGQLVDVLARADQGLPQDRLQRLLEQGGAPERAAALAALPHRADEVDRWLPLVVRLQASDQSVEVRAMALHWLTQVRHLPALDLAARAMRSTQPVEVEQGVRSALKLGGGGMRRAVAEHILACPQLSLQTAMLRAFDAIADQDFAVACRSLAADRKKPPTLRAAAALVAARALGEGAAPVLRDLAAADLDADTLTQVLRALLLVQPEPPSLASLFPPERFDLAAMPTHFRALLLVRHPEAVRCALSRLGAADTPASTKAGILRAIRLSLAPPPSQLELLPEPVRSLLR